MTFGANEGRARTLPCVLAARLCRQMVRCCRARKLSGRTSRDVRSPWRASSARSRRASCAYNSLERNAGLKSCGGIFSLFVERTCTRQSCEEKLAPKVDSTQAFPSDTPTDLEWEEEAGRQFAEDLTDFPQANELDVMIATWADGWVQRLEATFTCGWVYGRSGNRNDENDAGGNDCC